MKGASGNRRSFVLLGKGSGGVRKWRARRSGDKHRIYEESR